MLMRYASCWLTERGIAFFYGVIKLSVRCQV